MFVNSIKLLSKGRYDPQCADVNRNFLSIEVGLTIRKGGCGSNQSNRIGLYPRIPGGSGELARRRSHHPSSRLQNSAYRRNLEFTNRGVGWWHWSRVATLIPLRSDPAWRGKAFLACCSHCSVSLRAFCFPRSNVNGGLSPTSIANGWRASPGQGCAPVAPRMGGVGRPARHRRAIARAFLAIWRLRT
jgi:hypothetical protein